MKRLVWIFLAVFCAAVAQVQPVTLDQTAHRKCCCGGGDCSCGMPQCLPPAQARTVPVANSAPQVQVSAARQAAVPVRRHGEKFFVWLVEAAAVLAAPRAPERVTLAASVPLFAVHCSYLI